MSRSFVSRVRSGTSSHVDVFDDVSKIVFRGRRSTFATSQHMRCTFRGRRSTLDVSILIFVAGAALQTCRVACFFANRIGRAARSGDQVQIAWQGWHFVRYDEI